MTDLKLDNYNNTRAQLRVGPQHTPRALLSASSLLAHASLHLISNSQWAAVGVDQTLLNPDIMRAGPEKPNRRGLPTLMLKSPTE